MFDLESPAKDLNDKTMSAVHALQSLLIIAIGLRVDSIEFVSCGKERTCGVRFGANPLYQPFVELLDKDVQEGGQLFDKLVALIREQSPEGGEAKTEFQFSAAVGGNEWPVVVREVRGKAIWTLTIRPAIKPDSDETNAAWFYMCAEKPGLLKATMDYWCAQWNETPHRKSNFFEVFFDLKIILIFLAFVLIYWTVINR